MSEEVSFVVEHYGHEQLAEANEQLASIIARLSAENTRLRELARGLYEFAYAEYPRAAKAGFADDLRELGVEVNE